MIQVPQDQVLSINFDESVVKADGSTLKTDELSEIITLKETDASGEDVGYSAFIDAWKKVITITPDTLKPSQMYYLELMAGTVADNSGNVLTEAIGATFTTAEEQGILELTGENFAKIYPNPNNGMVTLEFHSTEPKEIRVFNMKGNVVYAEDNNQLSFTELSLKNIPKGVYVVEVTNQISKKTIRLKMLKR
jgi:hypothetical protein